MTTDKILETFFNILTTNISPLTALVVLGVVSFAAGCWVGGL